jgi:hypothetical protein
MIMETPNREAILKAFAIKILGVRNYKAEKRKFDVGDLTQNDTLDLFLNEVLTGESDITPAGKAFIERYYGFEKLATDLAERATLMFGRERASSDELYAWLKNLQPMKTISFVEQARGRISAGAILNADLLPPED